MYCTFIYVNTYVMKNWCIQTVVLKMTLESLLDSKKIKPVNPKGNQPWISTEGLMLKLKLQYFGHQMGKTDSLEKTLMLTEIEGRMRMGWQRRRWLDGINESVVFEFEQRGSEGQGSLACMRCKESMRCRESDTT